MFYAAEEKIGSIFENSPIATGHGPQFRLKENIRFHLYTSKGPCGDATAFGTGEPAKRHQDR